MTLTKFHIPEPFDVVSDCHGLTGLPMDYKQVFEDEGFIYQLTVKPSVEAEIPQAQSIYERYSCSWAITGKQTNLTREVKVTDDECEIIVYHTIEAAVAGARDFLSI